MSQARGERKGLEFPLEVALDPEGKGLSGMQLKSPWSFTGLWRRGEGGDGG